jgi:Tfp pilus assembly protein PilV
MKNIHQTKVTKSNNGFSLPEVLVSSSILMMVVAGTAQTQIHSIGSTADANQHNAVQALIAEDIDKLRRESFRWMCKPGTACTGEEQFADVPMRYLTGNGTALGGSDGFCAKQTLAVHMVEDQPDLFPLTSTVNWGNNAPERVKAVTVNRSIQATGNELMVSYSTNGGARAFSTSRTLVPQALHWCG